MIEKLRELGQQMRANLQATRKLIRVDELSETELTELIDLYEPYQLDHDYNVGDVFKQEEKLYKVIQPHTSQADWLPDTLPALYLNLMPDNVIPEWVQPTMAEDAYNTGDKVIFEGQVYESLIDSNTWSPIAYPAGWKLYVA